MNHLVQRYPEHHEIHLVLDNLGTHSRKGSTSLARHPNVHFHFAATNASWLNQLASSASSSIASRCATRSISLVAWPFHPQTLSVIDLLLTKLQVVQINEKDLQDAAALLSNYGSGSDESDTDRFMSVLASNWGWWRTSAENLTEVADFAEGLCGPESCDTLQQHAEALMTLVASAPKSTQWKLRALASDRIRFARVSGTSDRRVLSSRIHVRNGPSTQCASHPS